MKRNYNFCLSAVCLLLAFLVLMNGVRRKEDGAALAARIAPEILRFHVLANSDSPDDQALKLDVKEFLLKEIRAGVRASEKAGASSESETADGHGSRASKEAVCRYILENKEYLERITEAYMNGRGFYYPAEIRLESCEFPERTYGDMTFPAGTYDAVRVLLGKGEGKNFWCVLYPSLCYLDSIRAVVPDESKETLRSLLLEDDFRALITSGRQGQLRLKIRFRLAELFSLSKPSG